MWFGIVESERGLLLIFGNKHLKAWQQKEKIKNIRWKKRNQQVEWGICQKSFADLNAWKASFPSNFVLGRLPDSNWFSCKSDENSTYYWEMRPRMLSFQGIKEKNSHDLNQLCQVIKDHKNHSLMNFVEASHQHCLGSPRSPPLLPNCLDSNKKFWNIRICKGARG